jgi:hypothetical protein
MIGRLVTLFSLFCMLLLAACDADPAATGTPPAEPQWEDFATVEPTITPTTALPYTECIWNWASNDLPDVTTQFQAALDTAGITYTQASAYAYGENCLNQTGEIQYFAEMETDFRIELPAADLDPETLGTLVAPVLMIVVNQFPPDSTPGPQPGRIEFRLVAGSEQSAVTVEQERAEEVVRSGLSGAALWEALAG